MVSLPKTQYAKSGDLHIAYQVTGTGPVDLVFVPGFVSHLEYTWEHPWSVHFFERLGSFSRLIRFDKRGTGLSDRVGGIPTLEQRIESDRVLATVLFTDVVGSTEKAAALGDRQWHELLDNYYSLARRELARFRGREVDTAGDGFFAAFDGPARAIRCAEAISKGVRPLGIEVRAGLHTGECEVIGEKVGGIAVHIGARVASLARAGEVLVSNTVKDLVAGSGIAFEDRGTRTLKGVPGDWRLFAVTPAG
jgi:class 3 adenylate cyclase